MTTIFDPHNLKKKSIMIKGSSQQVIAEGENLPELMKQVYGKKNRNQRPSTEETTN